MESLTVTRTGFRQRGFTLLEMLTVIALLLIFITVAGSAIGSLVNRSRLTDTGHRVAGMLELGRIHATTYQRSVVLRFYAPIGAGADSAVFDAAELIELVQERQADGTLDLREMALGEVCHFPTPVVAAMAFSEFFSPTRSAFQARLTGVTRWAREIRLLPDGTLSLLADVAQPFLCLASRDDLPVSGAPVNPFVLSVNPATGRVTTLQR